VTEHDFAKLAQSHSALWRCLAVEIARRLRQRLRDVPPKNEKPLVFIGSSREGLPIANAVKAAIEDGGTDVRVWTDGVFGASQTTIESLESTVRSSDIAVLVFSPDDKLRSRGTTHIVPRDNVIFELGLFMGALGRNRAFVVRPATGMRVALSGILGKLLDWLGPEELTLKVPTDLLGVTPLTYEEGGPETLQARLAPACDELKRAIARLGAK
jgi:predicted nucleotide-binding protein